MRFKTRHKLPLMQLWRMLAAILLLAFFVGCAGVKPNPAYTRKSSSKSSGKSNSKSRTKSPKADVRSDRLSVEVQHWWGTPYRWGGDQRGFGVDCSAYTQAVMKNVYGMNIPRTSKQQYSLGSKVGKAHLRRGDLVFFNTSGKGVSHVGIYLGSGKFTHASNSDGVTIDKLSNSYYRKRYLGARRYN